MDDRVEIDSEPICPLFLQTPPTLFFAYNQGRTKFSSLSSFFRSSPHFLLVPSLNHHAVAPCTGLFIPATAG
jgi:hypothetical protein